MKKLEKKSGRRASRKRKRMERLLEEVAPERDVSGLVAASFTADKRSLNVISKDQRGFSQTDQTDSSADGTSAESDCPSIVTKGTASQTQTSGSDLNESSQPSQAQTTDSRNAAHRRRRMKRIKEELRQQVNVDGSSRNSTSIVSSKVLKSGPSARDQRTAATEAADAVRQIAEAPKDDNDPTARSMVAIAGAVTALASAIQFRLTDGPDHEQSTKESSNRETSEGARLNQVVPEAQNITDATEDSSGTEVPRQRQSQRSNKTSKRATPAELAQQNDSKSDSEFADSFFDDDESDVAGAYTVLPPAEQPVESYRDWFRRVVVRNKWMTWFTAFYVHWLIFLIMMMVFVHGPDQAANLLLNGAFADAPEIETESFDMSVAEPVAKPASKEEAAASQPVSEKMTVSEMAEETLAISDSVLQKLSDQLSEESGDTTNPDAVAENAVRAPAIPAGSVSQGSFSVWTEPEYPDAGEPYRIIVQIQLPPNTQSYHLRDLNGVVVGSDGYRKPIPGINPGPLPIVDGCVRMVIPIVSADAQVKDTIFIRSKLLKETQKLLIEF